MSKSLEVKSQLTFFPVNVVNHSTVNVIDKASLSVNSLALSIIIILSTFLAKIFLTLTADLGSKVVVANLTPLKSPNRKSQMELSNGMVWISARMAEETLERQEIALDLLVPYKKVPNEECLHIELSDDEPEYEVLL